MTYREEIGRGYMEEKYKLLPCPFCGGGVSIHNNEQIDGTECYVVECRGCGAVVIFDNKYSNKDLVIELWDRREGKC